MAAKSVNDTTPLRHYYYDPMDAPPAGEPESTRCQWFGRGISALGAAGSLALRCANLSRYSNPIASLGSGFFAYTAVAIGWEEETPALIRQVASTALGACVMYGLSNVFANDDDLKVQQAMTASVIALGGANLAMLAKWLIEKGRLEIEPKTEPQETLPRKIDVWRVSFVAARGLGAAGLGAGAFTASDPIVQGLCSFFSSFIGFQIIGEVSSDLSDLKIRQRDLNNRALNIQQRKNPWRLFKTALMTLGIPALIPSFVPVVGSLVSTRSRYRVEVLDMVLGFFNGFSTRSQLARMERPDLRELAEFQTVSAPAGRLAGLSYKIWRVATPVVVVSGVLGFSIWQAVTPKNTTIEKISAGACGLAFLGTYTACTLIDRTWKVEERNRFRDGLFKMLWVCPYFDPLYVYYAGINAVAMDGEANAQDKSPLKDTVFIVSWVAYGSAMGREFVIGFSEREGHPGLKLARLALINGAGAFAWAMSGDNR